MPPYIKDFSAPRGCTPLALATADSIKSCLTKSVLVLSLAVHMFKVDAFRISESVLLQYFICYYYNCYRPNNANAPHHHVIITRNISIPQHSHPHNGSRRLWPPLFITHAKLHAFFYKKPLGQYFKNDKTLVEDFL